MDNFILTSLKKGKKLIISNLIMTSIRLKHNNSVSKIIAMGYNKISNKNNSNNDNW